MSPGEESAHETTPRSELALRLGMRQYQKRLLYGEAWMMRRMFLWGFALLTVVYLLHWMIARAID
jgi:hypothetical protein